MTYFEAAATFRAKFDADRNANQTAVWHATVGKLEAGYYVDDVTARAWRQIPAADAYAATMAR